jgi:hypothetical protein
VIVSIPLQRFQQVLVKRFSPVLALFVVSLQPQVSWAADSTRDKVAAEALFQDAHRLMEASRYAEACPKLAESQRLDPAVGTLLYLGLCFEHVDQTASAWQTYLSAESAALKANQSDRAHTAHERASALEAQLTRLKIEVQPEHVVPGLAVSVDGVELGQPAWDVAMPVDPGSHFVSAKAPGKVTWSVKLDLHVAGSVEKVVVPLLASDASASSAPKRATAPPQVSSTPAVPASSAASDSGNTQKILGVSLGIAGVVGLGVGTFFALQSQSKGDESNKYCGASIGQSDPNACTDHGLSLNSDAKVAGTIAKVGFGIGGTLLAGGIVVYLVAPRAHPQQALRITPQIDGRTVGLRLDGALWK